LKPFRTLKVLVPLTLRRRRDYAILAGMDVRDGRVHNYPPRWNGAPSPDLLVIRRNHQTGAMSFDPPALGSLLLVPFEARRHVVAPSRRWASQHLRQLGDVGCALARSRGCRKILRSEV
jgi:hypothetical protein